MRKFFLFFLALILSCAFVSNAQQYDIQLDNAIYVDGIASVQLISGDDQLSEPVAVLGDKFHISFDDLNLESVI